MSISNKHLALARATAQQYILDGGAILPFGNDAGRYTDKVWMLAEQCFGGKAALAEYVREVQAPGADVERHVWTVANVWADAAFLLGISVGLQLVAAAKGPRDEDRR